MPTAIDSDIVLAILQVLKRSGYFALPLDILTTYVNGELITRSRPTVIFDHLQHCQEQGWVEARRIRLDKTDRYFITEAGLTALARA